MRMISTARTLLADPRRRFAGALLIVTLILGVVTMHAMSGSSTVHMSAATVATSVEHHPAANTPPDPAAVHAGGQHAPGTCDGDCGHHAMTAMCLMVLAALLTLAGPALRARLLSELANRSTRGFGPTLDRRQGAPNLDTLGVSRT